MGILTGQLLSKSLLSRFDILLLAVAADEAAIVSGTGHCGRERPGARIAHEVVRFAKRSHPVFHTRQRLLPWMVILLLPLRIELIRP